MRSIVKAALLGRNNDRLGSSRTGSKVRPSDSERRDQPAESSFSALTLISCQGAFSVDVNGIHVCNAEKSFESSPS